MSKKSEAEKSELVRGAGFAAALWIAFAAAVREAGGSNEDIHRLGTEEGKDTLRKMARVAVLRGECEITALVKPGASGSQPAVPTTHQVTVDYGKTLEEMIAAGRYDTRNNDITAERFPFQGTGQVEVELHLVHLGRDASTDTVLAELDRRNLRPATIEELLALGAKYPNLQKQFPFVALGSVWQHPGGRRGVACLGHWDAGRGLALDWFGLDWNGGCRFLAVSK